MKRKFSERNENNKTNNQSKKLNTEEMINSFRRVTRSGLKPIENLIRNARTKSTKTTDSNKKKSIPLSKCPYVNFLGEIKYHSKIEEISKLSNELYERIESQCINSQIVPISFDMEWPFNFKTGPGKTSVIQMSICGKVCYVFSVGEIDKIPYEFIRLLEHPKIILHGVNIKNDLRKLQKDFSNQINSDVLIEKCIDLGTMYNEIKKSSGKWSLEKLVNKLCRLQIDKSMKIRMSKWNVIPLEEQQLKYAANDVYIGYVIYEKLKAIKQEKEEKLISKKIMKETEV